MSIVLVTGANGNVASRLVRRLANRRIPVRAFVHSTSTADFPSGVEVFRGDLLKRVDARAAVKGVESIYLVSAGPDIVKLEAGIIEAAAAERVQRLVKHSVQGAQYEAAQIGRWHRTSEKAIEAAGIPFTFLRPASFASNALAWAGMLKGGDAVYGPMGEAALPVIDPDDIAAVAERVLTEPGHLGKAYELTGPASMTTAEQVGTLGQIIGRPLAYVNVPDDAARKSMLEAGMSSPNVDWMLDLVGVLRRMGRIPATPAVSELLGRPPRSFEEWCKTNANAFR